MESMHIFGTARGLTPVRGAATLQVARRRGTDATAPTAPDVAFPALRVEV